MIACTIPHLLTQEPPLHKGAKNAGIYAEVPFAQGAKMLEFEQELPLHKGDFVLDTLCRKAIRDTSLAEFLAYMKSLVC